MPAHVMSEVPIVATNDVTVPPSPEPQLAADGVGGLSQVRVTEEVVVSGISCRLPESDNMAEFREHLVKGEDMVTETNRRWEPGMFGLPKRSGTLKDTTKFDAAFFGVHPKQADAMDPQLRMLLEVTYEALVDSGVNPQNARGSRTGVFIGCSASEAHEAWTINTDKIVGYEMTGCTRSMFANRLSYFFDFKGPSYAIDTACSSSLLALDQALQAIRIGLCDSAIVGGSNLCLNPSTTLQFQKLGMLSPDGACKSFDASGNGYCRSEGIVAIHIQKVSTAKRIYCTLVHSKNNSDGNKEQGITFPSGEMQQRLVREVYAEAGVDPAHVTYVEAHGTGTKAGDPQELNNIAEVFCRKGRQGPLLIGSTKSNMGHPEPASGLAALAKLLISMEDGAIPANLHYESPNPDIPGLSDGRLQVVTTRTQWAGGLAAINSFGFGGSNVHALLRSNQREGPATAAAAAHPASGVMRLVTAAGRTPEAVQHVLGEAQRSAPDVQLQALLQESADSQAATHPYRGFALLNCQSTAPTTDVQKCSADGRPVWYVFAGMGTQWHGMGRDLMTLDVFRRSIMRSDSLLRLKGIRLYDLLMTGDEATFSDTLNSFVGIAAIQVALVDVLKSLGLEPDGIVGHSVGELGCAYADGGLTAEETVLAAYWRGRCVLEAKLPPGGMAAVGLTWAEAKARCPPGVVPACHNAVDTVTISGPKESVAQFVAELKTEGVFAKEVNSAGVAFHSHYMANTAPALLAALQNVIKEARPRTSRWVSSSIPQASWGSHLAKYSSAEYHVNNLVSPVLFQEALQHVPKDAVTIEIAPHCLLQAILKRSLGPNCSFVGLMKRNHSDNMEFLLSNLGKLYMAGVNFNPLKLYEPVSFPVSRGTPMVSPLVQWDHSQSWNTPGADVFCQSGGGGGATCVFEIDVGGEVEDQYLAGHVIDGRVLYPATGYLVLTWRALAKLSGNVYQEMPVAFEDVHIHRATILPKTGTVKLDVNITQGTGHFEVCENGALVVSGRVFEPSRPVLEVPVYDRRTLGEDDSSAGLVRLTTSDIYKELRLRGYDYGPTFQGILAASNRGDDGHLMWNDNWVSFLDTMLQIQVLSLPGRGLRLPTRFKSLRIDPEAHQEKIIQIDSERKATKVYVDKILDTCVAGGAEILGLHATVAPRRQQTQNQPVLENFRFVPYFRSDAARDDVVLRDHVTHCVGVIKTRLVQMKDEGALDKLESTELLAECIECGGVECEQNAVSIDNAPPLIGVLGDVLRAQNEEQTSSAEILKSKWSTLKGDPLITWATRHHVIRNCVDVAMENGTGSRMKIVEYTSGPQSGDLYNHVLSQLASQPMLQVSYHVTGPGVQGMEEESLQSAGVGSHQWSLESGKDLPNQLSDADVLILNSALSLEKGDLAELLCRLKPTVRDGGFILLCEPTANFIIPIALHGVSRDLCDLDRRSFGPFSDVTTWTDAITKAELELVSHSSDGFLNSVFLCRKCSSVERSADASTQTVIDVTDLSFGWLEEVKAAMEKTDRAPEERIWLTVDGEPQSGVVGMVNCLRQESGGDRIRCIFRADSEKGYVTPKPGCPEFASLMKKDLVMNVHKDGCWGSFRHVSLTSDPVATSVQTKHAFVNVLTRGDLSSLRWFESPLKHFRRADHPDKELCDVAYTSLNFRDIMLATGKLPPDAIPGNLANEECLLGMEFSGYNSDGKRVMGLLPAKGLATAVDSDPRFLWPVPDDWSLREAASVPVVYATAYYALVVRGRLKRGDRVLIHSGSGGVGQAAIAVALHLGCHVYTTIGSPEKRAFLQRRFPTLTDECFANSRDRTFEWDVLRATGGRGVDVVLNSLAEDKLKASLRVLAPHGRFLEIGKFDLSNDTPLGMSIFLRNITFHGILLDALFEEGNSEWGQVAALLSEGIKDGAVTPLNTTVFDKDDIEDAFRFMAQGKHIGKVVVKIREEPTGNETLPEMKVSAISRTVCRPHKSYIITGGLGGFGMELSHWLIQRGCRHLILTSRSGVRSGYQSRCLRLWRDAGIKVVVSQRNVASLAETEDLLREASELGPVGGVFHLAMVLRDGLMENQTCENFHQVAQPKVAGTAHLDRVTRRVCAESLDMFVVFSSVSCGRGNAGQANYGFANSFMERVCEHRTRDGLPGTAVQWGAIGDVGVVLDTMGTNDTVIGGTLPQRINSCLSTLDFFLNQSQPVMASMVLAERRKATGDQSDRAGLVDAIAHILGIKDPSSLNADASLGDLGLDSLMGVEVKQTLERDYDLVLAMRDIRSLTMDKLRAIARGDAGAAGGGDDKSASSGDKASDAGARGASMDDSGVSVRYDISHIMPSETIIKMADGAGAEGATLPPVFVIHPIEGVLVSLETVVGHLNRPVYGLQCTTEAPLDSLPELAAYYIKAIRETQPEGPYRLMGYSFGACVAFEIAIQLQRLGQKVDSAILLDGSHSYVAAHTQQYKGRLTPGSLAHAQSEALCAFVHQFTTIDYSKLSAELLSQQEMEGRVTVAVDQLMATHQFISREELFNAALSFWKKLLAADQYTPTEDLTSTPVTLIRASSANHQATRLGTDYGLGKVCRGTVSVHTVDGDHESFIQGDSAVKVARIINQSIPTGSTVESKP